MLGKTRCRSSWVVGLLKRVWERWKMAMVVKSDGHGDVATRAVKVRPVFPEEW